MKNGLFQNSFDQIVIDRGPWFPQEKSQRQPVAKHVPDGFPQAGVRLRLMFRQLRFHPLMQGFHQRAAVFLMETQAFLRR